MLINQNYGKGGSVLEESTLNLFQKIEVQHPSDVIIQQIQELISKGELKPGTKLPSERELSQQLHIGRGYVRQALKKLEFFGIVQTSPKQGTVIASIGVKALEGLISNLLYLKKSDVNSLFETRAILEINSAELAAQRATDEELKVLRDKHEEFMNKIKEGYRGLEEDHVFHLRIAECSQNSVLGSLIGLITPDIIQMNIEAGDDITFSRDETMQEHQAILDSIVRRDAKEAKNAMAAHMERAKSRRFRK